MSRTDQPATTESTPESDLPSPPINAERLLQLITDEYESLPRQLKRIASYMSQQSDRIMVDRISDIARECEVHPSAIVRFSQRSGFSGFSEMQALFREAYTHKTTPVQNYQQRIRSMIANKSQKASGGDLARECVNATLSGLERLSAELDDEAFDKAVDLVVNADNIYVVGVRRSFAVADYLVYNLQHTNKRIHLISGLGGSYREQMRSVRANDLVIAISFTPWQGNPALPAHRPASSGQDPDHHGQQPLAAGQTRQCGIAGQRRQLIRLPLPERHVVPVSGAVHRRGVPPGAEGRSDSRAGGV